MCTLEFPELETRIRQQYPEDDVIVLGISGRGLFGNESTATLSAFVEQTSVQFPILRGDTSYFDYADPDGAISPFPLDVVVGRDGSIAYLRREFDADAMVATIERLLPE
ncbi:MAG: peroxiredoxin family protein [Nannocystaceae bacterium]|nr:peroxiredoxin family protein [Nannocystaceae bacterium]